MSLAKRVIVTFREPGFHRWKEAAEKVPEVAYLASTHRHLFHWRVEVSVKHSDRQVEFHVLLERAIGCVKQMEAQVGWHSGLGTSGPLNWSCEQRCEKLIADLTELGYAPLAVECWEDGECGARVEVS